MKFISAILFAWEEQGHKITLKTLTNTNNKMTRSKLFKYTKPKTNPQQQLEH